MSDETYCPHCGHIISFVDALQPFFHEGDSVRLSDEAVKMGLRGNLGKIVRCLGANNDGMFIYQVQFDGRRKETYSALLLKLVAPA